VVLPRRADRFTGGAGDDRRLSRRPDGVNTRAEGRRDRCGASRADHPLDRGALRDPPARWIPTGTVGSAPDQGFAPHAPRAAGDCGGVRLDHKAEVLLVLDGERVADHPGAWHNFLEERAALRQYNGRYSRGDAEPLAWRSSNAIGIGCVANASLATYVPRWLAGSPLCL